MIKVKIMTVEVMVVLGIDLIVIIIFLLSTWIYNRKSKKNKIVHHYTHMYTKKTLFEYAEKLKKKQ